MTDGELLVDLAPVAQKLFDRHVAAAKPWYPHRLVPWERVGRRPMASCVDLPDGVRSALIVNLLTEDNLPAYVVALHGHFGAAVAVGRVGAALDRRGDASRHRDP